METADFGPSHHDPAGPEGREGHKQNGADETANSQADVMFARAYLILGTAIAVGAAVYLAFSFLAI